MFKQILFLISFCTIYTASSSNNWELLNPPGSSAFTAIFSLDTSTSVAVGALNTIIKTTDGGDTWYFPNVPQTPQVMLYSVAFNKSGIGIAGGSGGNIFYSTDNGENWKLSSVPTNGIIYSIRFLDDSTVFAVTSLTTSGEIFYSTNYGDEWVKIYSISQGLSSIWFNSPTTGFVVGNRGTILRISDRGQTWSLDTSIKYQGNFSTIYFLDSSNGWITGTNGVVLKTTNGGVNWEFLPSPKSTDYLQRICFISLNEGWVCSLQGRLFYTTDGGNNWSIDFEGSSPYSYLFDIAFPSPNLGFVVGGNNIILRFKRYLSVPFPEPSPLFNISQIEDDIIFSISNIPEGELRMFLVDILGNIIPLYYGYINDFDEFSYKINISHFSKGLYLAVVNMGKINLVRKLIVIK